MKKATFTLILLFLCTVVFAQAGCITYNISCQKKEINTTILKKKGGKKALEMIKNAKDIKAVLYFTNKESSYKLEKKMKNDAYKQINLTEIFAGKNEVTYYSKADTINLVKKSTMGKVFLVEKNLFHWEITQETKKIGQYLCYKAIAKYSTHKKRKITAWFTPQIPVRFGPKQFNGLPGLVLEVSDNTLNYNTVKIELNPKEKPKINIPTEGKRITEKEYKKLLKKYFPNFFKSK